eukprot:TRINITY_DN5022_c0_g1_i1.p1 TRINITY_DN5022_c0_g1~~TRINITY_DN5022_c0_g1_i1.p1  ORF type:complete len:363 (-),score=48.11 TRINITY_DN5022_c0_g1_i1:141-1229(-)
MCIRDRCLLIEDSAQASMASPADSLWDHDFETDAEKRVQEFLDQAADSLFQDSDTAAVGDADLKPLGSCFPYIRVRGSQCLSPPSPPETVAPLLSASAPTLPTPQSDLTIIGGHCLRQSQQEVDAFEETLASHGIVEELIAVSAGCRVEEEPEKEPESEILTQLCEMIWAKVVSEVASTLRQKHSLKPPSTASEALERSTYSMQPVLKRADRPTKSARSHSTLRSSASSTQWQGIKDFGVVVQPQQLHRRTRKGLTPSAIPRGSGSVLNKSASEPALNAAACVRLSTPPATVVWARPSTSSRQVSQKPARLPNLVQVSLPNNIHADRSHTARDNLHGDSFLPDIAPKPHSFHPNRRGAMRRH